MQDQYQTVAEALRSAVTSLLKDESMKYKRSFYYWAAFISQGFAGVLLDDALLDEIHTRLQAIQKESSGDEAAAGDDGKIMEAAMMTLTRNAYLQLEDLEQTLSREWCSKWNKTNDERQNGK